jgi:hypothetical protein
MSSTPPLWFNPDDVLPGPAPAVAPPPATSTTTADPAASEAVGSGSADQDPGAAAAQYPQAVRDRAEIDRAALRRRMLTSAALHGTARTWRDRRRLWSAVAIGIALVVVAIGVVAVVHVFRTQTRSNPPPTAPPRAASAGVPGQAPRHAPVGSAPGSPRLRL